jgi:hypothetical protein
MYTLYTTSTNLKKKLCILPTQCICVFRMVLTTNRDYISDWNTLNRLIFVIETECVFFKVSR